jgi:DNA repair photolyase
MTTTKAKKSVIYEPKGKALEYCPRAMNIYAGCTHGCLYCSSPLVLHKNPEEYHGAANRRLTAEDIEISAAATEGDTRPVLLSFISDPYQPEEERLQLTRYAIETLHNYSHTVTILTKAGLLAQRDFGLYRAGDSFGATLTFLDERKSRLWEPGAGPPLARILNLMAAYDAGIPTWVSLEPVIEPHETLALIAATSRFVDHYKVGKLNYDRLADKIDWTQFALDVTSALHKVNRGFYIKQSLAAFIGHPEGIKEGRQLP